MATFEIAMIVLQKLGRSFVLCLLLGACHATGADPSASLIGDANDPFEASNRHVHDFNVAVRQAIVEPAAKAVKAPVIAPLWEGATNVIGNLNAPLIFVNDLAQDRGCHAEVTLKRFLVNTTLGIGGLFDVAATDFNWKGHDNGFAQTFQVWGVPEGPYLVLPFLGPSNVRAAAGFAADMYLDPMDFAFKGAKLTTVNYIRAVAEVTMDQVEVAPQLSKIENSALDGYVSLRSAYRQNEQYRLTPAPCASLYVPTAKSFRK